MVHVVTVGHQVLWVLEEVGVMGWHEEGVRKEGWLGWVRVPRAMWLTVDMRGLVLPRLASYLWYAPRVTGVIAVVMR